MRVVYMGTADFAVPSLQALDEAGHEIVGVITQPDRPRGRGKQLAPTPVKKAAIELGIEVFQPESIKDVLVLERVSNWDPECLIVVAYGQLLPKALLKIPHHGCINVHASLLPQYRGGAPIHRAIMDGQLETGVTTMFVSEGLDEGDIILQSKTEITPTITVGELHDRLAMDGAKLLIETLALLAEGQVSRLAQVEADATYAQLLSRDDEKIYWEQSAQEIVNLIRGMNPWPGAYTSWGKKILKIWQAKEASVKTGTLAGTVLERGQEGLLVACGDGQGILITELQLQGRKRLPVREFLMGNSIEIGTILGCD